MSNTVDQTLDELKQALTDGDSNKTATLTRKSLDLGVEPLALIQNVIVPTLTQVGQDFQDFVIFLPELMASGDAAEKATAILEEALASSGQQMTSLGTVVIGTVENDVHDIGKNIVSTLVRAHGFKVVDLGRDVAPSVFLEAAQKEKADIVAMSSLMTTTRPSILSTINLFKEVELRNDYKFIIGGGSVTQVYADEVGADGFAPDAAAAVEVCKAILKK